MRLAAPRERADEDDQIGDPDHRQPQVDVPFGFGIFAALGDAEEIAGRGEHDEQLVTPEDEAGEAREGEPARQVRWTT